MYREKVVNVKGACYYAPFLFAKMFFISHIMYSS